MLSAPNGTNKMLKYYISDYENFRIGDLLGIYFLIEKAIYALFDFLREGDGVGIVVLDVGVLAAAVDIKVVGGGLRLFLSLLVSFLNRSGDDACGGEFGGRPKGGEEILFIKAQHLIFFFHVHFKAVHILEGHHGKTKDKTKKNPKDNEVLTHLLFVP